MTDFEKVKAENAGLYALPMRFYLAKVTSGSGTNWKIQFDGTSSPTQKYIRSAYGVTLAVNSRVLVAEADGTFFIIARIP